MSELKYNGHEDKYLKKDAQDSELNEVFEEQFNKLKEKLREKSGQCCDLLDGELMAVMLFTHENQGLYRDIKTNMTGKKMDKRKLQEGALAAS